MSVRFASGGVRNHTHSRKMSERVRTRSWQIWINLIQQDVPWCSHLLEVAFSEFWLMNAPKHVSLQCLCLWAVSASRRGNKVNALETHSNKETGRNLLVCQCLSHFHLFSLITYICTYITYIHFIRVAFCWCLFWFHDDHDVSCALNRTRWFSSVTMRSYLQLFSPKQPRMRALVWASLSAWTLASNCGIIATAFIAFIADHLMILYLSIFSYNIIFHYYVNIKKVYIYTYTSINPYTSSYNCTIHHVCIVQYFARMQALLRIHRYSNFDVGGRDMLGDSITALENDISTRNMFLRMLQNCQRCRAM